MKGIIPALILSATTLLLTVNCSNKKNDNTSFSEILDNPTFASLTDSIKKEPTNDDLYFKRAVLLNTKEYPEPSLADFKKAWSLKKDERYAVGVGTLLLDKKPDSAILFLEQALQDLPKSFLLQLTLARALNAEGQTDKALVICNNILDKNPEQVDILKMKADLLDKKGDKAGMISTLEKAYRLTPDNVELIYVFALKLAEAKNIRVLALCDSLIKADSLHIHAEPYYYKGIYYSNINDKEKALAFFNNAIKVDYNFLDGYIEKGSILYDLKKYNEALDVFKLCLTISPKFADAYYWIAKSQEAMGQKQDAKLNYERAFNLDAELIEAKQGAERLSK